MISENRRRKVLARMQELVQTCQHAQYKTPADLPHGLNRVTVGQYPSLLDFSADNSPDLSKAFIRNVEEANGSTFMGLWFLSGCVPLLEECDDQAEALVYVNDPATKDAQVEAFREGIRETLESIHAQLEVAAALPKFYQGGTEAGTKTDFQECPQYTMGWYPLVDKYRLPAVISEVLDDLLRFIGDITKQDLFAGMANLSDGDIWSWCMAIDDTTPDIFEYFGQDTLIDPDVYEPLLGTYLQENLPADDLPSWLSSISIQLWDQISASSHTGSGYPIETFYQPTRGPKGAFSCAVMGNVLASIPLLDDVPAAFMDDIQDAALFVREAAKQALRGEISWMEYAYDYYTIPSAPVGYLMRAHRNIVAIKERADLEEYPDLLDDEALQLIAKYTATLAQSILDKGANSILAGNDDNPSAIKGNVDYATLVYCFQTMMNLWVVDPVLYESSFKSPAEPWDRTLVALTAELLLTPNEAANRTPGTGPYKLFDVAGKTIYVMMGSLCFILPPLLEAYSYYLLSEAEVPA